MSASPFANPIFIIGCNRSGTHALFRNLSAHPQLWSLYIESAELMHEFFPVHDTLGERVTSCSDDLGRSLIAEIYKRVHNKEYFKESFPLSLLPAKAWQKPLGRLYKRPPLRWVDKTPANSLRVPLLASLFPEARFIVLVRRGEDVVSSLMEGWKRWSGTGDGEWVYGDWHYLAPPGWQEWRGRTLEEICAFQWTEANRTALADVQAHAPDRSIVVRHEDLVADPVERYEELLDFCQLPRSGYFQREVVGQFDRRVFTSGGSAPRREKWRDLHGPEIERIRERFQPLHEKLYEAD